MSDRKGRFTECHKVKRPIARKIVNPVQGQQLMYSSSIFSSDASGNARFSNLLSDFRQARTKSRKHNFKFAFGISHTTRLDRRSQAEVSKLDALLDDLQLDEDEKSPAATPEVATNHLSLEELLADLDLSASEPPFAPENVKKVATAEIPEALATKGFEACLKSEGLVRGLGVSQSPNTAPRRPSLLELAKASLQDTKEREEAKGAREIAGHWEDLSAHDRMYLAFRYVAANDGLAFTLNFTEARASKILAAADPARNISLALSRALKKHFDQPVEYTFALEVTEGGRLHLHGCIALPVHSDANIAKLRKALKTTGHKAASGKYSGSGRGRQVDTRELFNSTGWHGYCSKDFDRTRALLGHDKITYRSRALTQAAKQWHESQTARKAPPASAGASAPVTDSPAHQALQRPNLAVFAKPCLDGRVFATLRFSGRKWRDYAEASGR